MSGLAKRSFAMACMVLIFVRCEAGDKRTPDEQALDTERAAAKGILVGQPKLYDDSVLQQMLSSAA